MKASQLVTLGIPRGKELEEAIRVIPEMMKSGQFTKEQLKDELTAIAADPASNLTHPFLGTLAKMLVNRKYFDRLKDEPVPYRIYGTGFEDEALSQMNRACRLPVSVRGALMPDAHTGYGLPIGGVLAVDNAVIPYAVGVDIACRMKMSVLDLPLNVLDERKDWLISTLESQTAFGNGARFENKKNHPVMDENWTFSKRVSQLKDLAWSQLGTSGSGNHFVEFGTLKVYDESSGLKPGTYVALLSHSGSRGTGNQVGRHYSEIAEKMHPDLPKEARHLAWLELSTVEGQEYWQAMELMGKYASASHALIHSSIAKFMGVEVIRDFENHHNFAWKETYDGKELIVHRKGATPAHARAVGIIPGSMATPGFLVRGKGETLSLNSASHGAGRQMSRTRAMQLYTWDDARKFLSEKGVTLVSGGLDEIPFAYKDIEVVMAAQSGLVEILARFDPKIVKMDGSGDGQDI